MLTKSLSAALLGATLLAAPAMAQQTPPAGGAGTGPWITQEAPGQWRTSKLDGLDVYNNNDEKIGDIKELLVDNSGKIQAVVIGVGGFLGMGEHDVAIPFDQVKFVNEPRANTAANNTAATNTAANNTAAAPAAGTTNAGANPTGTANTGVVANTTTGVTAPANTSGVNSTGAVTTANRDAGNRAAPDHAMLNMTKDQLKAAPEFKYAR